MLNSRIFLPSVRTACSEARHGGCDSGESAFFLSPEASLYSYTGQDAGRKDDELGPGSSPCPRQWHQAPQFYWMQQLSLWSFASLKCRRILGRYFSKYKSCLLSKAPGHFCLMNCTASSYFIPPSINARATSTGAHPRPATQWTAIQQPGSSRNWTFTRLNQSSTIWLDGGAPSSNGQSRTRIPSFSTRVES